MTKNRLLKYFSVAAIIIVAIIIAYNLHKASFTNQAMVAFPSYVKASQFLAFVPWPLGPQFIGRLSPDDELYDKQNNQIIRAKGLELVLYSSDGHFVISPIVNP